MRVNLAGKKQGKHKLCQIKRSFSGDDERIVKFNVVMGHPTWLMPRLE